MTTTSCWSRSRSTSATRRLLAQVEQRGRLVGDEDRRLHGEHSGEGEELPLAARQGVHGDVGVVSEAEPGEGLQRPADAAAARCAWRRSESATSSTHVGITSWAAGSVKQNPTRRRTSARPARRPAVDQHAAGGGRRRAR